MCEGEATMRFIMLYVLLSANVFGAFPYMYKDDKGYSVEIPKKPTRIVIGGGMWPLPSVIIMLEKSAKSIVYMPKSSKNALKNSFLLDMFPEINAISSGENENIEDLLSLKPDLFVCHSANIKLCQAMKQSKIPTIELSVNKWGYNSFETIKGWITVLAPILDVEIKAKRFLDFTQSIQDEMMKKVRAKSNNIKPKALVIHYFESDKAIWAGGIFADYLLQTSGGQNVIASQNIVKITLEDIYKLNPDIIYINNFNTLMPQDILKSPLWKPIKAIQNKRVYKFPLGSYRPFAPSVDLPILLQWLYMCNYPNEMDFDTLLHSTEVFYRTYFDLHLSKKQIMSIFSPTREAGEIK